jgi:hypothetical protein
MYANAYARSQTHALARALTHTWMRSCPTLPASEMELACTYTGVRTGSLDHAHRDTQMHTRTDTRTHL